MALVSFSRFVSHRHYRVKGGIDYAVFTLDKTVLDAQALVDQAIPARIAMGYANIARNEASYARIHTRMVARLGPGV